MDLTLLGHYTTAYELAILSNYALQNPTFKNIVGTKKYTITINYYPKTLLNTNELLGNLDGIYGIKTGFTNGANRCLVTACKRGNFDIICVVLGADTKNFRTKDSIKIIEYCIKNYEYFNIKEFATNYLEQWKKDNSNNIDNNNNSSLKSFSIEKGTSNDIEIALESGIDKISNIPIKKDLKRNIKAEVKIMSKMRAPVSKGDLIGTLEINSGNNKIAKINLVSKNNIRKKGIINYLLQFFKKFCH